MKGKMQEESEGENGMTKKEDRNLGFKLLWNFIFLSQVPEVL